MSKITRKRFEKIAKEYKKKTGKGIRIAGFGFKRGEFQFIEVPERPEEIERALEEVRKEEEKFKREFRKEFKKVVERIKSMLTKLAEEEEKDSRKYLKLAEEVKDIPTLYRLLREFASDEDKHSIRLRSISNRIDELLQKELKYK